MAKPFRSRAKVKDYYEEASGSGMIGRKPVKGIKTLEQYTRDMGLDRGIPSDTYPTPPESSLKGFNESDQSTVPEGRNIIPENVTPPYASPANPETGWRDLGREEAEYFRRKKNKQNTGPSVYKK